MIEIPAGEVQEFGYRQDPTTADQAVNLAEIGGKRDQVDHAEQPQEDLAGDDIGRGRGFIPERPAVKLIEAFAVVGDEAIDPLDEECEGEQVLIQPQQPAISPGHAERAENRVCVLSNRSVRLDQLNALLELLDGDFRKPLGGLLVRRKVDFAEREPFPAFHPALAEAALAIKDHQRAGGRMRYHDVGVHRAES